MKTLAVVLTLPLESMSYLSPAHLPHVIPRPLSAGKSLCWWGEDGAPLEDAETPGAYWAEFDSEPQYQ